MHFWERSATGMLSTTSRRLSNSVSVPRAFVLALPWFLLCNLSLFSTFLFCFASQGHDDAVLKSVDSFSFLHHPVHQRSLEILQRCQEEKYSKAISHPSLTWHPSSRKWKPGAWGHLVQTPRPPGKQVACRVEESRAPFKGSSGRVDWEICSL